MESIRPIKINEEVPYVVHNRVLGKRERGWYRDSFGCENLFIIFFNIS